MSTLSFFKLASFGLVLSALAGCSAPSGSGDVVDGESAMGEEASGTHRAALAISQAEGLARQHATGMYCEQEATSRHVLDKLREAVSADGSAATRQRIEGSAILQQVVGKLVDFHAVLGRIRVEGGRASGLASAAQMGIEVYGLASGAYGNTSFLSLGAGGVGKARRLRLDDEGLAMWSESSVTYRIVDEAGGSVLIVTDDEGEAARYTLRFDEASKQFAFDGEHGYQVYESFASECEA